MRRGLLPQTPRTQAGRGHRSLHAGPRVPRTLPPSGLTRLAEPQFPICPHPAPPLCLSSFLQQGSRRPGAVGCLRHRQARPLLLPVTRRGVQPCLSADLLSSKQLLPLQALPAGGLPGPLGPHASSHHLGHPAELQEQPQGIQPSVGDHPPWLTRDPWETRGQRVGSRPAGLPLDPQLSRDQAPKFRPQLCRPGPRSRTVRTRTPSPDRKGPSEPRGLPTVPYVTHVTYDETAFQLQSVGRRKPWEGRLLSIVRIQTQLSGKFTSCHRPGGSGWPTGGGPSLGEGTPSPHTAAGPTAPLPALPGFLCPSGVPAHQPRGFGGALEGSQRGLPAGVGLGRGRAGCARLFLKKVGDRGSWWLAARGAGVEGRSGQPQPGEAQEGGSLPLLLCCACPPLAGPTESSRQEGWRRPHPGARDGAEPCGLSPGPLPRRHRRVRTHAPKHHAGAEGPREGLAEGWTAGSLGLGPGPSPGLGPRGPGTSGEPHRSS